MKEERRHVEERAELIGLHGDCSRQGNPLCDGKMSGEVIDDRKVGIFFVPDAAAYGFTKFPQMCVSGNDFHESAVFLKNPMELTVIGRGEDIQNCVDTGVFQRNV